MDKDNKQHIENQFIFEAGSNTTIIKDCTFNAPVYTSKLDDVENDASGAEMSNLEFALRVVASMAKEGWFKMQKNYIAAFRIIEEMFAPGITTSEFCRLMEAKTDLSMELLPNNNNIRRIYYNKKDKYPNWSFTEENAEWVQNAIDIAKEMLIRLNMKR